MTFIKKLAILAMCLSSLTINAAQINPEAAQRKAQRFLNSSRSLKSIARTSESLTLAYTSESIYNEEENCYYVFNRSNGGFVIVSADDCAEEILGTVDEGQFNLDEMPESMKWWLNQYNEQISEAIQANAQGSSINIPAASRHDVDPLITAKWDQGAPYNEQCPLYPSNGKATYTGCVATAIAQIMYSHKWPETGKGSHSYTPISFTDAVSADFSEGNYDWDNMTDTYNSSSTQVQKDAVAKLMYHCGVMVDMQYDYRGSTAYTTNAIKALWKYMGYAETVSYRKRPYYNEKQWEDIIYNEVSNGRSVLYTGGDISVSHAFVCDGYRASDNTFHFNWGWSGIGNGYFKLSVLHPLGDKSDMKFETHQTIIIGIKKPEAGDKHDTPVFNTGSCYGKTYSYYIMIGSKNSVDSDIKNSQYTTLVEYCDKSDDNFKVQLATKFTNTQTGEVKYVGQKTKSLGYVLNYTNSCDTQGVCGLEIGVDYEAKIVYKDNEDEDWKDAVLAPGNVNTVIVCKQEDGTYTFTTPKTPAVIKVDDVTITNQAVTGGTIDIDAKISNTGESDYEGSVEVSLVNEAGSKVATFSKEINIEGLSTKTVSMSGALAGVISGSYTIVIADQTGQINADTYNVTVATKVFTDIDTIESENAADVKIASGIITAAGAESLEVYNMAGQLVASAQGSTINASAMSAGMYIVKATIDGNTVAKQIVK